MPDFLSFTDVGKSCQSRESLTWQICLLILFTKKMFSQKFTKGNTQFYVCFI